MTFEGITKFISAFAAPAVVLIFCFCLTKNKNAYSSFIQGAQDGLKTALGVFPVMTLLLVSLGLFEASGAAEGIGRLLSPVCSKLGIPEGIIPLIVTRPFSGSASTAAYTSLLGEYGADSFEGFAASIIMGSGDTLVYVISVYYSAVKSKKAGRVFPISAFAALFAVFFGCTLARIFYTRG